MEILWKKSPLTASEVVSELQESTDWAKSTVRTLLHRLIDKGALNFSDNEKGVREFTPIAAREQFVKTQSDSFLHRIFQGTTQQLLVHFASNSKLSAQEVQELKELLDRSLKK